MTHTTKTACRYCGQRSEHTWSVAKTGGGTYRRAGRSYRGQTCVTCVESALRHTTPRQRGDQLTLHANNSWDIQDLITALAGFLRHGATDMDRDRWAKNYAISGHQFVSFDDWFAALTVNVQRRQAEM